VTVPALPRLKNMRKTVEAKAVHIPVAGPRGKDSANGEAHGLGRCSGRKQVGAVRVVFFAAKGEITGR
jgi:hypothetical protein